MIKIKDKIGLFFMVPVALLASGCFDNTDCANSFSDIVVIRFVQVGEEGTATPTALADLMEVRALEASQILYRKSVDGAPKAEMKFPMNPFSDTTTFVFEMAEGESDIVVAIFERRPILINPDCGMTMVNNINDATTTFDSARIVNPGLRYPRSSQSNSNVINLEIFY